MTPSAASCAPASSSRKRNAPTAADGWRPCAPTCCARCRARGIASDQPYRLADLAVDFCEDVPPLPRADIERIVAIFERHGAHAKVSSIHVNGWFGDYDKLTTSKADDGANSSASISTRDAERYVFSGDSPERLADVRLFSQWRRRRQRA